MMCFIYLFFLVPAKWRGHDFVFMNHIQMNGIKFFKHKKSVTSHANKPCRFFFWITVWRKKIIISSTYENHKMAYNRSKKKMKEKCSGKVLSLDIPSWALSAVSKTFPVSVHNHCNVEPWVAANLFPSGEILSRS